VRGGIEQLARAYREHGLTPEEFLGPKFTRLERINERLVAGTLDASLRPSSTLGVTA
jgi:hypothetical protein